MRGGGFCEPGQRPSPVLQAKPCSPSPALPGLRAGPAACATLPPTCVPEPRLPNTPYSAALISHEHPQDMTPGTPHTRSCWAATLSKLAQPTLCFSQVFLQIPAKFNYLPGSNPTSSCPCHILICQTNPSTTSSDVPRRNHSLSLPTCTWRVDRPSSGFLQPLPRCVWVDTLAPIRSH